MGKTASLQFVKIIPWWSNFKTNILKLAENQEKTTIILAAHPHQWVMKNHRCQYLGKFKMTNNNSMKNGGRKKYLQDHAENMDMWDIYTKFTP